MKTDAAQQLKQQAAEYAVQFIAPGMVVGLGAGSTAILAVRHIGHLLKTGQLHDIVGIPCSTATEGEARELGIPLVTLEEHPVIDVTIDGADEVDPQLELIKGGGGALTREKIVAQATRREIIIVDETKLVPALGTTWAVPVEVVPFGYGSQQSWIETLGARVQLRLGQGGEPYRTDQGNFILDCDFGPITQPKELAAQLKRRTGVVEHGLFIGIAADVICAGRDGIRHLTR